MDSFEAFAIVIVTVSVATILINIFFICCMFSSQEGPENLQKPPLNVLLGLLIGCNLFISISMIFSIATPVHTPYWIYNFVSATRRYAMRISFTASLGLNVFYYFQIVPARHIFLIWVKTHIKLLIYLMLFFVNIFILFGFIWNVFTRFYLTPEKFILFCALNSSSASLNSSSAFLNSSSASLNNICGYWILFYLILTDFWLRFVYFLVGFGIMVASNTSTVLYLCRHVRRMADSSSSSALHYQTQKRVAILSIIQTVLFFIYSALLTTLELKIMFEVSFAYNGYVFYSGFDFYCFSTTIILGVGQTKFRLRAVDIWKKIGQVVSRSNLNVGDRNGHFNCCLNFCHSNTENGEMLTIADI